MGPQIEEQQESPEMEGQENMDHEVQEGESKDVDDAKIAVAAALDFIKNPEFQKLVEQIMQQPNMVEAMALNLSDMIEEIIMSAQGNGIELSPNIWFMDGGALDQIADELTDIAGDELLDSFEEIKDMTLDKIRRKAEDFQRRGQAPEEAPQEMQQAPQRPPAMAMV